MIKRGMMSSILIKFVNKTNMVDDTNTCKNESSYRVLSSHFTGFEALKKIIITFCQPSNLGYC